MLVPLRTAWGELYVIPSQGGVLTFTNKKPAAHVSFRVFRPKQIGYYSLSLRARNSSLKPVLSRFDTLIRDTAMNHAMDPALVKAVVHVESSFNPSARSPKGAMGLMQLMPGTATRFGVKNAYRPEENVNGGVKYLRLLLDRYQGNLRLTLAAYNAGEEIVDQLREVPPYSETQAYVRRVLSAIQVYRNNSISPGDNLNPALFSPTQPDLTRTY